MAVNGWGMNDFLISADASPTVDRDWVGTDNDPWPVLEWQDDDVLGGISDIQTNRGRMVSADALDEPARQVAIMPPEGNGRMIGLVEIPDGPFRASFYQRSNGEWAISPALQHMEEGYHFYISRPSATSQPRYSLWRMNGAGAIPGATQLIAETAFGATDTTFVRFAYQIINGRISIEVAAGTTSAVTLTGVWTQTIADSMWSSGVFAATNGGNHGGTLPFYVHELTFTRRAPLALAEPYLKSFWLYVPSTAAGGGGVHLYDGNDADDNEARFGFANPTNGNINACSRASAANSCATFNPMPEDQWIHVSLTHHSSTLREIRVNAGAEVTNTASSAPVAPVISMVGTDFDPGPAPLDAALGIGSISYWDTLSFSATDRDNLTAELQSGRNPLAINADGAQPWSGRLITIEGVRSYAELVDLSDLGPYSIVGSLSVFEVAAVPSHPPVDPPPASVGGGAGIAGMLNPHVLGATGIVV